MQTRPLCLWKPLYIQCSSKEKSFSWCKNGTKIKKNKWQTFYWGKCLGSPHTSYGPTKYNQAINKVISIYKLGDIGILSNLIDSLSLANGQCPTPGRSIICKVNEEEILQMLTFLEFVVLSPGLSPSLYMLLQLFSSISLNSGFSNILNFLPLLALIWENYCYWNDLIACVWTSTLNDK